MEKSRGTGWQGEEERYGFYLSLCLSAYPCMGPKGIQEFPLTARTFILLRKNMSCPHSVDLLSGLPHRFSLRNVTDAYYTVLNMMLIKDLGPQSQLFIT